MAMHIFVIHTHMSIGKVPQMSFKMFIRYMGALASLPTPEQAYTHF